MPIITLTKPARRKGGKPRQQREVDAATLAQSLAATNEISPIRRAFVESVQAHPDQGVVSMFRFGQAFGIVIGVLAALDIPVAFVVPRVWKRAMGLSSDKELSRKRAGELFPAAAGQWKLKKHADRAEAALIAEYGRQELER